MLWRRSSALDGGVALLSTGLLLPVSHPVLAMSAQYVSTPRMTAEQAENVRLGHLVWSMSHGEASPQDSALEYKRLAIEHTQPWLYHVMVTCPDEFVLDAPDGT